MQGNVKEREENSIVNEPSSQARQQEDVLIHSQKNDTPEAKVQHPEKAQQQKEKQQTSNRKRHGARNQHRHKAFVKWVIDTFHLKPCNSCNGSSSKDESNNLDDNNTCHHVLDVAGGKGEVSARLAMCHRQDVVMVDPRPANLLHCFETLVLPKIPNKWQQRILEQTRDDPNFIQHVLKQRCQQIVTTFEDHVLEESMELQNAVQNASVILGLHADGATEAIVNAALKYNKPFVVVPCCVFPNLFQQRRVVDDSGNLVPVRSHEQFCHYLQCKDPRFQRTILPFEGRNVAIWWNGKS